LCGIIGITTEPGRIPEHPALVIRKGLERLEYRGYDSVGVASLLDNEIIVRKGKGKIREVNRRKHLDRVSGYTIIGHTRWATHGRPSDENAHPHTDCKGIIAVVHNGIIQNYLELREMLIKLGHKFKSETDTEVIAHLMEHFIDKGLSPYEAFKETIRNLKGSFALGVIVSYEKDKIFFARKDSPLIIGLGNGYNFIASDIPAFLEYTRRVVVVHDYEIGYITPTTVHLENILTGEVIDVKSRTRIIDWTPDMAAKGGYPHFMLKEIHEQPRALRDTIHGLGVEAEQAIKLIMNANRIFVTAAGTSFYAGLVGDFLLNSLAGYVTVPFIASEYSKYKNSVREGDVLIAISQSGETIDTLMALRQFKKNGAQVIAISNVVGSAIPRESDITVYTRAGPEIGVAATKTFTTQVMVLSWIAIKLAYYNGKIDKSTHDFMLKELYKIPELANRTLTMVEGEAKLIGGEMAYKQNAYYLGRGIGVPIALEGALKLKEIAYLHAEAYPAGESKHGPIALVEEGFPVMFVVVEDEMKKHLLGNIEEMRARGAYTLGVVSDEDKEAKKLLDKAIIVPYVDPLLSPMIYIIPLQLIAYYTAVKRGFDPDKPRNLAKTVTVE